MKIAFVRHFWMYSKVNLLSPLPPFCRQDPDFVENDNLYDELELDEDIVQSGMLYAHEIQPSCAFWLELHLYLSRLTRKGSNWEILAKFVFLQNRF